MSADVKYILLNHNNGQFMEFRDLIELEKHIEQQYEKEYIDSHEIRVLEVYEVSRKFYVDLTVKITIEEAS